MQVLGPVLDACVDDVKLEGKDMLEDVRARGEGLDCRERAEEAEGPEL